MAGVDAWEKILELARRVDGAVASRRGIDAGDALELARAVVAFHQRLSAGPVLASVPSDEPPPPPATEPAVPGATGATGATGEHDG
jgi:hypothetical protein